jgi:hypothetical protein
VTDFLFSERDAPPRSPRSPRSPQYRIGTGSNMIFQSYWIVCGNFRFRAVADAAGALPRNTR